MSMPDNIDFVGYSPSKLAQLMDVSRPTVYKWMRMDGFPVAHIGGCTRIPSRAFEKWLNEQAGVENN